MWCCRCCCCCCCCVLSMRCRCMGCLPASCWSVMGWASRVHAWGGWDAAAVGCPQAPVEGFLSRCMYLSSCCRAAEPKQLCVHSLTMAPCMGSLSILLTVLYNTLLSQQQPTVFCTTTWRNARFSCPPVAVPLDTLCNMEQLLVGTDPTSRVHQVHPAQYGPSSMSLFCWSCCFDVTLTLQAAAAAATTHTRAKAACSRPVMALVMAVVAMLAVMLCSCFLASLLHLK